MEPIERSSKPRNWTRKRVMRELAARGVRQADLVARSGRAQSTVSEVMGGLKKSLAVATVVADSLGLHPHDIWPRLYAPPPSVAPTTAPTEAPGIATAC